MTTFAETPEGREYLVKLQGGRPDDIGPPGSLEGQTFKMFQERRRKAGTIMVERDRLLKRIADDEDRVRAMTRQGDMATGEATAFAEVLLAAEEARRVTAEPKSEEDNKGDGQSDNEDRTTAFASGSGSKYTPPQGGSALLPKPGDAKEVQA